jgi:hypothetical protein
MRSAITPITRRKTPPSPASGTYGSTQPKPSFRRVTDASDGGYLGTPGTGGLLVRTNDMMPNVQSDTDRHFG